MEQQKPALKILETELWRSDDFSPQ